MARGFAMGAAVHVFVIEDALVGVAWIGAACVVGRPGSGRGSKGGSRWPIINEADWAPE